MIRDSVTLGSLATLGEDSARPLLPALTILAHPDVTRVGETAPLISFIDRKPTSVSRDVPLFQPYGSRDGRSLDHPAISKKTTSIVISEQPDSPGHYELRRGDATNLLELGLLPFQGPYRLTPDDLAAGVILTINKRVVLCLHLVRYPMARERPLALLGASDAIEDVRRKIVRAAAHPTSSVLILGETGVGKEPTARAIHQCSSRSSGPFIAHNMATLAGPLADDELFGHARGAFTDAKAARLGAFLRADGGTLFLDEIGETTPDVQAKLLRVLEDKAVTAVGADRPRSVDFRLITASDKDLHAEVSARRFDDALFFRLNTYPIEVPPLRARRSDIAEIFFADLSKRLNAAGAGARLREDPDGQPWIPARAIVRLALAPWPGNVRELLNLANHLVIESTGHADLDVDAFIRAALAKSSRLAPQSPPPSPATAPAEDLQNKRARISLPQLLDALVRARWNRSAAAKTLGVSRDTFYNLVAQNHPAVKKVLEISYDDLARQHAECGADIEALATKLGIPADVLVCRLRDPKR